MFDRVRLGWYSVHVTSHPDKIYDALNASIAVLRDIAVSPINRREVARARTTLLTRHESDMKDNTYWLGLMTHLQNDQVPQKTVICLRDLKVSLIDDASWNGMDIILTIGLALQTMYEAITVEDIYYLYNFFNFDDNHIFTCVGISGKCVAWAISVLWTCDLSELFLGTCGLSGFSCFVDDRENGPNHSRSLFVWICG